MQIEFQDLFTIPGASTPLTYTGDTDNDSWTNGTLSGPDDERFDVVNGVPEILGEAGDPWGSDRKVTDYFTKLGRSPVQVVEEGYNQTMAGLGQQRALDDEIGQIVATGGPVAEVNCGHGGGFAPLLLEAAPSLPLLLVDPGRWLLREWRELAEKRGWKNLGCVQAASTALPFADNSLAAITSYGGYANSGPNSPALQEARRVLKPGGLLLMLDARPDPSCIRHFPADLRDSLKEKYPSLGTTYPKLIKGNGFVGGSYIETGRRPMAGRQSTLAQLARQHKVRIEIVVCKVLMQKGED